jgi:hypothetical protein
MPTILSKEIKNGVAAHIYRSGDEGDWEGLNSTTDKLIPGETYQFSADVGVYDSYVRAVLYENSTEILRIESYYYAEIKEFVAKEGVTYRVALESTYGSVDISGPLALEKNIKQLDIVHETGDNSDTVMSQKAVTDELNNKSLIYTETYTKVDRTIDTFSKGGIFEVRLTRPDGDSYPLHYGYDIHLEDGTLVMSCWVEEYENAAVKRVEVKPFDPL